MNLSPMTFALDPQVGYAALFGLVFAESAGLPVPGETALLAAGVLAGSGRMALAAVVAVAAGAAILGDNLGYAIGRRGGRRLLLRPGPVSGWRRRSLRRAEAFFARYGEPAVFVARWVPVARYLTPLSAGAAAMPWRRFIAFNAAGALAWCLGLATLADVAGPVGAATLSALGLAGAATAAIGALVSRRRMVDPELTPASP